MKFFEDFEENRKYIKSVFKNCDDIVFKDFSAAGKNCFMVYTDNIVDGETIENAILTNLMFRFEGGDKEALEERGYKYCSNDGNGYLFENQNGETMMVIATDVWCKFFRVYTIDEKVF